MIKSRYNSLINNNPVNEILSNYPPNQIRPFKIHWLNSAHLETLLPGSNWEKIQDSILPDLCIRISSEVMDETRKQALFEIIGKNFISKQFPHESLDITITKPPFLSTDDSIKLYKDCENWLDTTIENIMKEKSIYNKNQNTISEDMNSYINQANQIFFDHFYKELAKKETEYLKIISTIPRNFRQANANVHHKPETAVSSVYDKDIPDLITSIYPYGPEMMISPLPHCNSFQSEFIGSSLSIICQNNEEETMKIAKKMYGRRLPISLRKLLWKNILLELNSPVYDTKINYEDLMKKKFLRAVTRGIGELKLSQEMPTPIHELLEHIVVEQYERCLPLTNFDVEFKSEAIKILNLLYIYERIYDRHFIFLLFPLHYGLKEAYDSIPLNTTFFTYEIALYLSQLKNIYPSWSEIFDMAERVILSLAKWNPKFVDHLLEIAQKNVLSQSKEFLTQIIDLEKRKIKTSKFFSESPVINSALFSKINNLSGFDLIKSPIIFIRKWIGEGFVSILKNEAVLYIFDQLFMKKFDATVFHDACIAVILLLHDDFLEAQDHQSMKNVFLKYPINLLTLDIIRAWICIHKGGDLNEVLNMNRRRLYNSIPDNQVVQVSSRPPSTLSVILPDVAFNNFKLKLIFPLITDDRISLSENIQEKSIFLTLSMCFNDIEVLQMITRTSPKLKIMVKDDFKIITSHFAFDPHDIIRFQNLNVTSLTNEFKTGDTFKVLVTVQYRNNDGNVLILGWCIVQCFFEPEFEFDIPKLTLAQLLNPSTPNDCKFEEYVSKLKVKNIRQEISLKFSDLTKVVKNLYQSSNSNISDILLEGSLLGIYLYDPLLDNQTPILQTPEPEDQKEPVEAKIEDPLNIDVKAEIKPKVIPIPKPIKQVPDKDDSYVPFNPQNYERIKPPFTTKVEPFCLYIDQIRFLPDNSTIIKVTGRFLQSGSDDQIPDILLFPDVESDPRSPKFRISSRLIFNENRKLLFKNSTLLILRVYTVLKTNLEIVVIGNCIVPVFDNEGLLLAGCYQKRLHSQLPDLEMLNNGNLLATSLDQTPYVDCVSITFRLWPMTVNPISPPDYKTGCYLSMECEPSDFEWDVFKLYRNDTIFSKDLRDTVRDIKLRDSNPEYKDLAVTHAFMQTYIPYRLDTKVHLPNDRVPLHIKTELMFHYRIEKGIHFRVDQIYGLKDEKLLFATAKVLRGYKTANMEPRPIKKYGSDDFIIFSDLDLNSSMKSSKWNSSFEILRPYYDEQALLIIQVWGVSASFIDGELCYKNTRDKIEKLSKDNIVGWTAIQLFKNGFVNTGKHQMPLYQNRIHLALLKRFQNLSINSVLQKEEEFKDLDSDSIVIYLLDGHKNIEEYPSDLPIFTEIIDSLTEKKDLYIRAMSSSNQGKTVYQEILEIMNDYFNDESKEENKISVFNNAFAVLSKKLTASIPPKQPYLPIII